jgi:small nuclear ribonucleoprotein (snRNP)-like protein
MEEPRALESELQPLIGEQVILDVKDPHLYIGTLRRVGQSVVVLSDADVHFCGDSRTTTELYALEAKKNGVRPNRREVFVMRSDVVSISRLDDVVDY